MVCAECGTPAEGDAFGWRGYRTDDSQWGEPTVVVFYCAWCSLQEFGPLPHQSAHGSDDRAG